MDIIKRNFLRLTRSGAFGEHEAVEPMSNFKWEVLFHVACVHNVMPVIMNGIMCSEENREVVPGCVVEKYLASQDMVIFQNGMTYPVPSMTILQLPDAGLSRMCNHFLNSRLQSIREKEPQADDSSIETLNMLDILVQATEYAMTYGLTFAYILRIGIYLRTEGDKVDFIKLERWLRKLCIARMAQLEGSILIKVFGFEPDEIPFVERMEPSAVKFAVQVLEKPIHIDVEEWKIRQKSTIFIANNSRAMMKTVNNCMRYFFFTPIEATANLLHRFASSLSNLEE